MFAAGLIASLVRYKARTSRQQERVAEEIRETCLKQWHLAEFEIPAAVASAQLDSTLAAMAIVVGELQDNPDLSAACRQNLKAMAKQIEICKQVSSRLLATTAGS